MSLLYVLHCQWDILLCWVGKVSAADGPLRGTAVTSHLRWGNTKDWLTAGGTGVTFPREPCHSEGVEVKEEVGPTGTMARLGHVARKPFPFLVTQAIRLIYMYFLKFKTTFQNTLETQPFLCCMSRWACWHPGKGRA